MDTIDAMALLYLSKHWSEQDTPQDYAQKFLQTRAEIDKVIHPDALNAALDRGDYSM